MCCTYIGKLHLQRLGSFGLTYCFAVVTSLISVLHFIYGVELEGGIDAIPLHLKEV